MNKGKICVSICAETADEFIENIKRAAEFADVVELRFDCLSENEFDSALRKISTLDCKKPFLATFRPQNKDAEFVFARRIYKNDEDKERVRKAVEKRMRGWDKILTLKNVKYVDFELDLHHKLFVVFTISQMSGSEPSDEDKEFVEKLKNRQIIVSHHFFDETPQDVDILKPYGDIAGLMRIFHEHADEKPASPGVPKAVIPLNIKVAAQANDITDSLILMKYLKETRIGEMEVIPIAMGEAGKWTRILGLAHGALMTYASLGAGRETAGGQITAKDLIETYRVKELSENTGIYGIIGNPVAQSVSPFMHNAAFKFHNLDAVFIPFEVKDLGEFIKKFVKPETREIELNFKGFSVTIPHKQAIIEFLDETDETAQAIGAVNTVKIQDGRLYGYNTDAQGFIEPLKTAYGDLRGVKVAVLGAGGAARACVYALKKENAKVTIFARNLQKAESLANEFQVKLKELAANHEPRTTNFNDFEILINTTPLGMKGATENETPIFAEQIENIKLVYDLVYNPFQTRLMSEADKANVPKIGGLAMLVGQAMAQQKIWTGRDAPMQEMSRAALEKLS